MRFSQRSSGCLPRYARSRPSAENIFEPLIRGGRMCGTGSGRRAAGANKRTARPGRVLYDIALTAPV